ncbi:hypothetical protein [Phormidesmis priestleyi]|nr:hypothetical protein [Phormidesmis priestleyi]
MALLLWVAGILAWSADRIWASSCVKREPSIPVRLLLEEAD